MRSTHVSVGAGNAHRISLTQTTVDGTATALSDYVATTGQITFASNQASATIRIPLQIEPGAQTLKSFSVILSNARGGATLGTQTAAEARSTDTR